MRLAVDALHNQLRHFLQSSRAGCQPLLAEALKAVDDNWEKNDVAAGTGPKGLPLLLPDALKGATGS